MKCLKLIEELGKIYVLVGDREVFFEDGTNGDTEVKSVVPLERGEKSDVASISRDRILIKA